MQRPGKNRVPVKARSKAQGQGLYLYTGYVPHEDFPLANGLTIPKVNQEPDFKKSIIKKAKSPELWMGMFDLALTSLVLALENHEPGGPGQAARQIAKGMRKGHQVKVLQPRLGLAFSADNNIPLKNINYDLGAGFGDLVEQNLQMGRASPVAHAWIVSTEPPSTVNANQQIQANSAAVFFSNEDALNFMKNLSVYCTASPEIQDALAMPPWALSHQDDPQTTAGNVYMLYRVTSELANAVNTTEPFEAANTRLITIYSLADQIRKILPSAQIKEEQRQSRSEAESQVKHQEHYVPEHEFKMELPPADIKQINDLVNQLTNELKNYLIFYSANRSSTEYDANEEVIKTSLTTLANLSQIELAKQHEQSSAALEWKEMENFVEQFYQEHNEDNLSFSDSEKDGVSLDKSVETAGKLGRLKDDLHISSSGFFSSPSPERKNQEKTVKGEEEEKLQPPSQDNKKLGN